MSVRSRFSTLVPTKGPRVPLPAWQDDWGKPRPAVQTVAATIFFAVGALIFIPYSIEAAESGNSTRITFGLLAILVGSTFVAAGVPHLRARRKRIPRDVLVEGADGEVLGLRFRLVRHWRITLLVWLAVGLVFVLARAALSLEQLLAASDQDRGDRVAFDVLAIALSVAAAGLLALLSTLLIIRTSENSLTVGKDGVLRRMGPVAISAPWGSIDRILPRVVNNVNSVCLTPLPDEEFRFDVRQGRGVRPSRKTGEQEIVLPAISFGVDPALLLCILTYYKEHPEERHELESEGALDRIKSGRLVGPGRV